MGAVADRSIVTLKNVKEWLKINGTDDDGFLKFTIACVKDEADKYLDNTFLDADGEELPIPGHVERWLFKNVVRDYENRPADLQSESLPSAGNVTWSERDFCGLDGSWTPRF